VLLWSSAVLVCCEGGVERLGRGREAVELELDQLPLAPQ